MLDFEWICWVNFMSALFFKCNILHRKFFCPFFLKFWRILHTYMCLQFAIIRFVGSIHIMSLQLPQYYKDPKKSMIQLANMCAYFIRLTYDNIDDETAEVEIWSPFVDVVDEFIKIVLDGAATIRVYKRFSAVRSLYTHYGWMGRPLPFFSQHSNAADVSFCYAMKWTFLPYHFVDIFFILSYQYYLIFAPSAKISWTSKFRCFLAGIYYYYYPLIACSYISLNFIWTNVSVLSIQRCQCLQ